MTGDKLRLINHLQTLSLDLSYYPFSDFMLSVGVYPTQASTRMEKVTIRAPSTINIGDFITFMEKGLSTGAARSEYITIYADGSQLIYYQYVTWEAKRLVWNVISLVVQAVAT